MSKDDLEMHIQKNLHMNKVKELIDKAMVHQTIEVNGIFNCSLTKSLPIREFFSWQISENNKWI